MSHSIAVLIVLLLYLGKLRQIILCVIFALLTLQAMDYGRVRPYCITEHGNTLFYDVWL